MKDNFQIDKAIMAFKSKRFEECRQAYESALTKEYSKEAWTGLSIVKLHLMSENQTAKDVKYSLDKTVQLYPKHKNELLDELLLNAKYLIFKYVDLIAQLNVKIEEDEKKQAWAAAATLVSAAAGVSSSTSKWSTRFNLATGAGLGYTMKKFSDVDDAKVVQIGILYLLKDTGNIVEEFTLDHKLSDKNHVKKFLKEVKENILSFSEMEESYNLSLEK